MIKTTYQRDILNKLQEVYPLGLARKELQDYLEIKSNQLTKELTKLEAKNKICMQEDPGSWGRAKKVYLVK